VLTALVAAGCSKDSSNPYGASDQGGYNGNNPTPPAPNTVVMTGMVFSPVSITVATGTTITWQNYDAVAHTATSDNGKWDTGRIAAGGTGRVTFDTPGTYTYNCVYHASMGMRGTVIVQ
jgi:plastocyanin